MVAAGDGDKEVADLCRILHLHHGEAVHHCFDRLDRIDLSDNDLCTQTLCAHRSALAAPAVARDDNGLARNDQIRRAVDAVPDGLPGAVAVIEKMLAVCIIDEHHREFQRAGSRHCSEAQDAGRGLLAAADDIRQELGVFLMNERDQIAAVVDDEMRFCFDHTAGVLLIFLCGDAVPGKDIEPVVRQCSRHIILCGKRIRAGDIHFRAACREHTAEIRGLCLQMNRQRNALAGEGLCFCKLRFDAAQKGHIALDPCNLLIAALPGFGESDLAHTI